MGRERGTDKDTSLELSDEEAQRGSVEEKRARQDGCWAEEAAEETMHREEKMLDDPSGNGLVKVRPRREEPGPSKVRGDSSSPSEARGDSSSPSEVRDDCPSPSEARDDSQSAFGVPRCS